VSNSNRWILENEDNAKNYWKKTKITKKNLKVQKSKQINYKKLFSKIVPFSLKILLMLSRSKLWSIFEAILMFYYFELK
jgi:hypothetical protein